MDKIKLAVVLLVVALVLSVLTVILNSNFSDPGNETRSLRPSSNQGSVGLFVEEPNLVGSENAEG